VSAGFDYRQIAGRLWPVLRQSIKGHTVVYRATHGLVGHRFPGAPPMLLDHVGAKSGKRRTTPLARHWEREVRAHGHPADSTR
jgi:F420H(2)-dependent quinone reductase